MDLNLHFIYEYHYKTFWARVWELKDDLYILQTEYNTAITMYKNREVKTVLLQAWVGFNIMSLYLFFYKTQGHGKACEGATYKCLKWHSFLYLKLDIC